MLHGVEGYFAERERNARRVSMLSVALGLVLLGALQFGRTPPVRRVLQQTVRFGFEGPNQYVRRIILDASPGRAESARNVGAVIERSSRKGGSATQRAASSPHALPDSRPRISGPGEGFEDLLARAYSRRADVPVVQSEDLIIERLVRPVYPEHARDNDIEGRVAVMALVDTTGQVVEVQVLEGGAAELERASSEAVWQCRFRPYRPQGRAREVYALFRFNFRIY